MRVLRVSGYVCLVVMSSVAGRSAAKDMPTILVRTYNSAEVRPRELKRAMEEVRWIFKRSGIRLLWADCTTGIEERPAGDPCTETADSYSVGLLKTAPSFSSANGLGFALLATGEYKHAGVIYPRVVELARKCSTHLEPYQVLAYVLTHEVVHLVIGSSRHGEGLFGANPSVRDLLALGQRNLRFSNAEEERIRRALRQQGAVFQSRGASARVP